MKQILHPNKAEKDTSDRKQPSLPAAALPFRDSAVLTTQRPDKSLTDSLLLALLKEYPQYFDEILANRKGLNVQIIYTRIDREASGKPILKDYHFNVNAENYFYPASTVKFPVTLLALQKLHELSDRGIDRNSTMITGVGYTGQTAVYNDPTVADGKPSVANYIKKVLMVSDNDAYNRLYELLGPAYINEQLHQKGYRDAQLIHRLQQSLSNDENRHTNPITFLGKKNEPVYQQPMLFDTTVYSKRTDTLGNGYWAGGQLIKHPMDCSLKNRISLSDLHQILVSLVFPEAVPAKQRFNITEEDRDFLLRYMSQLPTESKFPPYSADTSTYYPAYCKFLLMGAARGPWPANIRIFNKVGDAYGQLLDVAYIVDFDKKVEFFLSAVIYCNRDGILNDDQYDYDTVGYPFMKHLGQVIYEYELKRPRTQAPDLKALKFLYDQ